MHPIRVGLLHLVKVGRVDQFPAQIRVSQETSHSIINDNHLAMISVCLKKQFSAQRMTCGHTEGVRISTILQQHAVVIDCYTDESVKI